MNVVRGRSHNLPEYFLLSLTPILVLTGVAKVWSSFGSAELLTRPDPLFGLPFSVVLFWVGVFEVAIAMALLSMESRNVRLGLVAWLSTAFLLYRISLKALDWHRPCNCLGSLTDSLGVSPMVADVAMKSTMYYMLTFSIAFLGGDVLRKRLNPRT